MSGRFNPFWIDDKVVYEKLPNPPTMPTSNQSSADISDDNVYTAVGCSTSNVSTIMMYKRAGDIWSYLPGAIGASELPTSNVTSITLSSHGDYMATSNFSAPRICVYKRSGDTWAKMAFGALMPSGTPRSIRLSADGVYLYVSFMTAPYFYAYKRNGNTWENITVPTMPGMVYEMDCSKDGVYIVLSMPQAPYFIWLKRTGDTVTQLTAPLTLPNAGGLGVAISGDASIVTVSYGAYPYILTYTRTGDILTVEPLSITTLSSTIYCRLSNNGTYLSTSGNFEPTPSKRIFERDNSQWVPVQIDYPYSYAGGTDGLSMDGMYFCAVGNTGDRFTFYKQA